jgi:uncharacterized damage-inducible protein DinB
MQQLWRHAEWADDALVRALESALSPADAWREYTHIIGAEEVWLARLEQREPRLAVWPSLSLGDVAQARVKIRQGYAALLERTDDEGLTRSVAYRTSDGRAFTSTVGDILMQVVLHGQYHRGKVNLLLRGAGAAPAPVDFIAFARGAPAATRASADEARATPQP